METILRMTHDLIRAQIQQRAITPESLDDWLKVTHNTLLACWQAEHASRAEPIEVAVDWRKSIKAASITCLECGEVFRQRGILHLRRHGLDARTYRLRYGIPPSVPLSARQVTTRRRQIMRQFEVWKLAPHYKGEA